jgi:hypothetical protein
VSSAVIDEVGRIEEIKRQRVPYLSRYDGLLAVRMNATTRQDQ